MADSIQEAMTLCAMPASSGRAAYQRRRRAPSPTNNSLRRTYDLLRSSLHRSLGPGSVLVEEELIDALSASRNTVRAALQLLADQGLVTRRPRLGTTARGSMLVPVDDVLALGHPSDPEVLVEILEASVLAAPDILRERLLLPAGSSVALVEGVVLQHDVPVGVSTSYAGLPPDVSPAELPEVVGYLQDQLRFRSGECGTTLAAVACDEQSAELLCVAVGSPLLWLEDEVRDATGRPTALCLLRYRGDRVALSAVAQRDSRCA